MKLYTEEQVRQAYIDGMDFIAVDPTMYEQDADEYMSGVNPIELPSDEEIVSKAKEELDNPHIKTEARIGYVAGAKWMRNKLTLKPNETE